MPPLFVPMTKATGFGNLPDMLEQFAGSHAVSRAFHQTGLPMEIIEFPDTSIPVEAMRDLFDTSARAAGDRCFGLNVGQQMTHVSYGLWMRYCAQAETLISGLRRAKKCVPIHQTGCAFVLEATKPVSFWRYVAPGGLKSRPIQHCDHLIGPMIRFVQSYLGAGWLPEWIELNYPRDVQAAQLEARLPFPIRFGAPTLALAIRPGDLARRAVAATHSDQDITYADVRACEATGGQDREPLISVFHAITLRLLDSRTGIDGAACSLGVGVQGLQRTLRREGVNYRDLLNRAKCQRAQELLADTSLTIIDIALSLGYSDHANFSRAFKRMLGTTPIEYRTARQHLPHELATLPGA